MNSLPKTVTRQRRGCNLNPGPSAPESSTLTTRLPSHTNLRLCAINPLLTLALIDIPSLVPPGSKSQHLDWFVRFCRAHAHCCDQQTYRPRYAVTRPGAATCRVSLSIRLYPVAYSWLLREDDVIHKTGSTYRIATPSDEDRATAIDNMHKNLMKFRHV